MRFMHGFMRRFGRGGRHKFTPDEKKLTLTQMQDEQSGTVIEIQGGRGMINRLSALGVRPGQTVTKVSSMFMRGPVTKES